MNVINLEIPALRERPSDVPLLAAHFLRKFAVEIGKEIGGLAIDALELLSSYAWPGNVRELENVIERAVVMAAGPAHLAASTSRNISCQAKEPLGLADSGRDDGGDRALRD